MQPTDGPITQEYNTFPQASGAPWGHTGRDYGGKFRADVRTVADGVVVWADWGHKMPNEIADKFAFVRGSDDSGICVIIYHPRFDWHEGMFHLDETPMNIGDQVKRGQVVAKLGETGNCQGAHLHYEAINRLNQYTAPFGRFSVKDALAREDAAAAVAQVSLQGAPAKPVSAPAVSYVIDESLSDSEFTAALNVPGVFGRARTIESITIHHYGSFGQKAEDVVDFFVHRNPNTSAHFVAGRDNKGVYKAWCLVSPLNAAWAAGNAYGNATSIHIECQPEATDADYALVAWLVKWLRQEYGENLPLKMHKEWSATACPGNWDIKRVDALARGIVAPIARPAIQAPKPAAVRPAPVPKVRFIPDPHWRVDPGDTLSHAAAHFGVTLDAIARYNGIRNVNRIEVGERIWPPVGADTWVIEKGDTLAGIVQWYHANGHKALTVEKLQNANGINNPQTETKIGLRLQIPN